MSEKNIEIKMESTGVVIRAEHASVNDVGTILCTGAYHVCKELKIPVSLITTTLNAADKVLSTKEQEAPKATTNESTDAAPSEKESTEDKELSALYEKLMNSNGKDIRGLALLASLFGF